MFLYSFSLGQTVSSRLTMKMILYTIAFVTLSFVGVLGVPSSSVLDSAGVIRPEDRQIIENISQELWTKGEFALVILTVKDIADTPIEEYANSTYEELGIGSKKNEEGALVVLAAKQRRMRIEVGYGSEGYINDARAGRILDSYGVPYFKEGNFSRGLVAIAAGIAQVVSKEKGIETRLGVKELEKKDPDGQKLSPLQMIGIGILLILLLGTRAGRMLLFWFLITGGGRSHGSGGFGGRMGGGGFGGGFGGFGGGRSGGGGASRGF